MQHDPATHRVAVLALEPVEAFDLAIATEVFGGPDSAHDVVVCARRPGPVAAIGGFGVVATAGPEALAAADTVVVPGYAYGRPLDPELLAALRSAAIRGARMVSICVGAFALAEAGLLDGLRATTHWAHAARLAERYPRIEVDPDVLFVDHGRVATSAGMAAGIDLCLHLLQRDRGPRAALDRARRMVVPVRRSGNQAQFSPAAPALEDGPIGDAMRWAEQRLGEPITVEQLARRACTSPRTLSRWFRERVGASPHEWLTRRRVDAAARLLESPDRSVDEIAAACGLGSAANLRQRFRAAYGTTPTGYRAAFATAPAER